MAGLIAIDRERFLADLQALRAIGACGTGVVRPALTTADIDARRFLAGRMADAGLDVSWDPVGNLFGIAPGSGRSLLIGSHSDTQPEGGWLDGAFGVVCGLEVARAAIAAGAGGVSVVSFADEEGAFMPLLGSRFWTGQLGLEAAFCAGDNAGRTLGELARLTPELRAGAQVDPSRFAAYLEPHIEQGPVLDGAGEAVAIVNTIVGMRQIELEFVGDQNHAGTTPMAVRRDAVRAFVRYAAAVDAAFGAGADWADGAVWTFGRVDVAPNAVSIVPGLVRATLQVRAGARERLAHLEQLAIEIAAQQSAQGPCPIVTRRTVNLAPVPMDPALVALLDSAAGDIGRSGCRHMVSGALHDAASVAAILPSAMLFVPSRGGRSHRFDEDTALDDLVVGCELAGAAAGRWLATNRPRP